MVDKKKIGEWYQEALEWPENQKNKRIMALVHELIGDPDPLVNQPLRSDKPVNQAHKAKLEEFGIPVDRYGVVAHAPTQEETQLEAEAKKDYGAKNEEKVKERAAAVGHGGPAGRGAMGETEEQKKQREAREKASAKEARR